MNLGNGYAVRATSITISNSEDKVHVPRAMTGNLPLDATGTYNSANIIGNSGAAINVGITLVGDRIIPTGEVSKAGKMNGEIRFVGPKNSFIAGIEEIDNSQVAQNLMHNYLSAIALLRDIGVNDANDTAADNSDIAGNTTD